MFAIGAIGLWLARASGPEIHEISRVNSPNGKWTATARTAVYGDHWFVNAARNEVIVEAAAEPSNGIIVYSTDADGTSEPAVSWHSAVGLVIEDAQDAQLRATKDPYVGVEIEYRKR